MQKKTHPFLNLFIILASIILIQSDHLCAQTQLNVNSDSKAYRAKYKTIRTVYGMNIMPLAIQLVPLKRGAFRTGPYNFTYKKKNIARKRGFRAGIGAHIDPSGSNLGHLNIRIGTERIRKIGERWSVTNGGDVWFFVGNFNTPSSFIGTGLFFGPPVALGAGATLGIEYHFTPQISLSTESMLALGLGGPTGGILEVIPPVSIFFNVAFEKQKRK